MRRSLPLFASIALACGSPAARPNPALAGQAPRSHASAAEAPAQSSRRSGDSETERSQRAEPAQTPLQVLRGRASYYSDRLAGHHTANGDVYDPHAFTAASRELPFGTMLRVVREDTGASVVVRVNDRGPFGDRGRILDLSRAAAETLGMIRAGVIDVRAEVIEQP